MLLQAINHVAIHVSNLVQSVDFYHRILKLPLIARPDMGFEGAWLGIGQQEIHLIAGLQNSVNSGSRGNHVAFQTLSISDVELYLIQINYPYRAKKMRADGSWQLFLQDPDRYFIEIYEEKNVAK